MISRIRIWLGSPKPIGFFLSLLIAATIIPALGISAVLLNRNDIAQREITTTLAGGMAGSIADVVDRELSGVITTLRILSTMPSLDEEDIRGFYDRAVNSLAGTGLYLTVLDTNLQQLMNTWVPFGTPLPPLDSLAVADSALSSRAATISGIFFDQVSSKWIFQVMLPLFKDGQPDRLLVISQDAESMGNTLSEHMIRSGWRASLLDRDNHVISSTGSDATIGQPFFLQLDDSSAPQTIRDAREGQDEAYLTITESSHYSGWKVVVWAPVSVIEAPMRRTLWLLFAGSLIVIVIGTLAAMLLGGQITRPVRRLANDARRLGAGEAVTAVAYPIAEVATVSQALAEAARNRKQAENEIRLLMREVAHRSKNQLTVVSSMAKQTARHARSLPTFLDSFQKRLYGLARSTDLLIAGGAAGVELGELVAVQVEPFRPEDPKRLEMKGPTFRLANQAAQTIGLAIHELATNASKYGAFSTNGGSLDIHWKVEDDTLIFVWKEHVPQVRRRSPPRTGFGTEIIERMLGGTLDAEIERNFHPRGLECIFRIPTSRIASERMHAAQHAPERAESEIPA